MTKYLSCALFLVIVIGNPTGLTATVSDSSPVVQPPGERLSGAALPPATPTPAIDAKGCFDSGQAFFRGKEYDKAIGALNEAIRLDPNFAAAYMRRRVAFAEQGNFGSAIRDFNIAIRLDHK
jgi:tetratricopeptide (TPR) repeat protein